LDAIIPQIVYNYNNIIHAVTKTTPQVLKNTEAFRKRRTETIIKTIRNANLSRFYQETLSGGDAVRLKIKRTIFEKMIKQNLENLYIKLLL